MARSTSLGAYAAAYVDAIAEHADSVAELQAACDLLHEIPTVASYLLDPSIERGDKDKALRIALPNLSEETNNFLLLLSDDGMIKQLDRILELAKEQSAEREDRRYAEVTSAVPLTNEEVTRIASALASRLGRAVLIDTTIDETLRGGITVRIGDWVFDASLRGRLERLKKELVVGSS